jgi:hypothetical protein
MDIGNVSVGGFGVYCGANHTLGHNGFRDGIDVLAVVIFAFPELVRQNFGFRMSREF